jgi:membrane protein YqaA with SNARE-associated domain
LGTFSYEHIAEPLLYSLGKEAEMINFSNKYNEIGFWAVITAGISPIPYKVVTIMSGATNLNFAVFLGSIHSFKRSALFCRSGAFAFLWPRNKRFY